MNVIGYLRVSTREQADSGAGLEAQRRAISDEAARRGWTVVWIADSGESGKSMKRDGIQSALKMLKARSASALVVAKLDRLSRSVQDFAALLALSRRQKWSVVALDLGIDTTTPTGELVANVMMAVAQWERSVIAARTRDALAERKAAGVKLGRERVCDTATVARIMCETAEGWQPGASHDGLTRTAPRLLRAGGAGTCRQSRESSHRSVGRRLRLLHKAVPDKRARISSYTWGFALSLCREIVAP